ncbi:hypothetical protein M0805_000968 [Coniferiporia weirii]|nr:hypothetical protein M0805_000968 [Coniferiporia weirii]
MATPTQPRTLADPRAVFNPSLGCAKFITTNKFGRREVIVLSLDRPVTIGRSPHSCNYIIEDKVVSKEHCKLYATLSSTGGVLVSCQDLSTNGVMLNGYRLRKSVAIVMDDDEIRIPYSQSFKCVHSLKEPREKLNIFDPTPPQGMYRDLRVGKYTVVSHCLGSGSFASVHLAFDAVASKQVACKTIITKAKGKLEMQKLLKEVNILRDLDHPNISRILDVNVNETNGWLHIFLELCTGGDLFTYMTHHYLCEGEAKYIMYQIFKGIEYLHKRAIAHRENVLLYYPGTYPHIQIADFGLARPRSYQETLNVCGTLAYLPPEGVLALDRKDLGYIGMPADCWSAGVILYTLLSGSHPFDRGAAGTTEMDHLSNRKSCLSQCSQGRSAIEDQSLKIRIIDGVVKFDDFWDDVPDAKILVHKLLIHDHRRRESVSGALSSPWFTSDMDELQRAYNERIGHF